MADDSDVRRASAVPEGVVDRFSERMRQGIAHGLGWDDLRPVQKIAAQEILDGRNTVILAPTAGGKTEAAFLPALDLLYTQQAQPVGCIYVSPTRALLNNQETRAEQLCGLVGQDSFKWHGDVGQGERERFVREPAQVLLTTPESLEAMLQSELRDTAVLFAELRFLIVDEAHAFAAGDRGAHLLSVTERLQRLTPHDIQRICLSATVGNPAEMAHWFAGSSQRPWSVVEPEQLAQPKRLAVRWLADEGGVGPLARQIIGPHKGLFFVNSRRMVEGITVALRDEALEVWPHHGSLSRERREEAEAQFQWAERGVIVATSTLELGIDIGDLDVVLQLDAPGTVSSYLQRLGRTGRRPGSTAHLEFITLGEDELLLAIALVRLAERGWVEPVPCPNRSAHVLVHQVLAKVREHHGVSRSRLKQDLWQAACFRGIAEAEFDALIDHLVQTDILNLSGGLLAFGEEGERKLSRRRFSELYSVFTTPRQVVVQTRTGEDIGTLETWFVEAMEEEAFVFVLGGRKWVTVTVDLERDPGLLVVEPAPAAQPPRWRGLPSLMSREVAEEHRSLLLDDDVPPWLLGPALPELGRLRGEWRDLLTARRVPMQITGRDVAVHTFAGGRINLALRLLVEQQLGLKASAGNLTVEIRGDGSHVPWDEARNLLGAIATGGCPTADELCQAMANLPRFQLSKLQPYLPPEREAEFLGERLVDFEGLRELLSADGWGS